MDAVMEAGLAERELIVQDRPELGRRYHPTSAAEVAAAKALFDSLNRRGYFAYREGEGGGGGGIITTFDETAERIVLMPQMIGG